MIKVSNAGCIRRLGFRSMRASRSRNIIAVLAIALTTVLFTSLFTIAVSINYSYQQENFRRAGGDGHGSLKDVTWEQIEDLRDDPLIVESWARMFVGMPTDPPFNKSHVEVSYLEPQGAPHYFCAPVEGTLPQEGTDQAATDTRVLALLGVEPEPGARFTISFYIDMDTVTPQLVTRTYTLSGWWEYDSAMMANHLLIPRSEAEEVSALSRGGTDTLTGRWTLDMMFRNALNIEKNIQAVLLHHGYGEPDSGAQDIGIGVNWGYTGSRLDKGLSLEETLAIAALLALIVFTGYLIIYNVFQISVTNDIRFYGMLKTIGATGRQLRRIIRQQALLLSLMGIPLGLLLGFVIGNRLTPVIMAQLSYTHAFVSFSPLIFMGAAVFSLLTVFLSCARPGRVAARVPPVEALRYTGGGNRGKRSVKKGAGGASLPRMAWANLGRSRGKTAVTVVSLTLAVVLACLTCTFAIGFDMDKYLERSATTDFVLGHADYFQYAFGYGDTSQAVPEEMIAAIGAQGGIAGSGRVYGQEQTIQAFLPEEYFRQEYSKHYSGEALDSAVASQEHPREDTVVGAAQLYGLEDFILGQVNVLEGDITPLSDPGRNAIAAVYYADDYGVIYEDVNCFRVGDTVTLRYVEEWTNVDIDTGEEISPEEADARYERGEASFMPRAKRYTEKEYTVCARIEIPSALTYRYSTLGASELAVGAELFQRDTGTSSVMVYAFNTTEEANAPMEDFLAQYTENVQPEYDYESRATYAAEFEGFQNMFLILGSTLSLIIGLVGVLNFINAILTGILTRKRELATLQSIGMTGKQLKTMLVFEGLYYTLLALSLALVLTLAAGPLVGNTVTGIFWFFTYRFTVTPILLLAPVFALLGAAVPLAVYRSVSRFTIVERLREADG